MSHSRLPALGMRRADPRRLARTVTLPLTAAAPAHPLSADHLAGISGWVLGGNDRYGTCGPVSVANSAVLTWHWLLGADITVSDAQIFDLYRRSGNPSFNPATGAGDNGVDMTVMLAELVRNGVGITHPDGTAEIVKPVCFASHPTDPQTVQAVTSIFGFDLFGMDLKVAQQAQTAAGLWDYVARSSEWGGHATCGGAYTGSAAARTADEKLITWAQVVGTTDAFLTRQLQEGYVVVWPALWAHPAFQAGVDQAALAAAYTASTGRPFPLPVTPPPVTPPSGNPDPALAAAMHAWLDAKAL